MQSMDRYTHHDWQCPLPTPHSPAAVRNQQCAAARTFCHAEMSQRMTFSTLSGSWFSTSDFTRRNRNGRKTWTAQHTAHTTTGSCTRTNEVQTCTCCAQDNHSSDELDSNALYDAACYECSPHLMQSIDDQQVLLRVQTSERSNRVDIATRHITPSDQAQTSQPRRVISWETSEGTWREVHTLVNDNSTRDERVALGHGARSQVDHLTRAPPHRSSTLAVKGPVPPPNCANGLLNHASKLSTEWKILGSRKLSRDHSSGREFCSGVPVSNSRCRDVYFVPNVCNTMTQRCTYTYDTPHAACAENPIIQHTQ